MTNVKNRSKRTSCFCGELKNTTGGMKAMMVWAVKKWRKTLILLVCLAMMGLGGSDLAASIASASGEPFAAVKVDGKFGYIDKNGELVIPAKYSRAWKFSEGLGKVLLYNKFGFIDKDGTVVILPQFDRAPTRLRSCCSSQQA